MYNNLSENFIGEVLGYIDEERVFLGKGLLAKKDREKNRDVLLLDFQGHMACILWEDIDYQISWNSLVPFVGRNIHFMVKEIDRETGMIYLSRKAAQLKNLDLAREILEAGQSMEAQVTGFLPYGCYLSIDGAYVIMRNTDYSDGYVNISQFLEIGDRIRVRLASIGEGGRISVQPLEKRTIDSILSFDLFEKNQVVEGVVRSIRKFGVFVGIASGLDALCNLPKAIKLREGNRVRIRITDVFEEEVGGLKEERVRGTILEVVAPR